MKVVLLVLQSVVVDISAGPVPTATVHLSTRHAAADSSSYTTVIVSVSVCLTILVIVAIIVVILLRRCR